jgi:hypothetical protein
VDAPFVTRNFVPLALDTYYRGDSQDVEFCKGVKAGGNHIVIATAGGLPLGGTYVSMKAKDLAPALEKYRSLPEAERKPTLPDLRDAKPGKPVPEPPAGGLILRGYCAFLQREKTGALDRRQVWYFEKNPDRWEVETQSDFLWMTPEERKSLVPASSTPGTRYSVPAPIQARFYGTIGIDYMTGSVPALPCRESTMTLTVERSTAERIALRLDGYAKLGEEFEKGVGRGCEVRVLGFVEYDPKKGAFRRFDVVGTGKAWRSAHTYSALKLQDPWMYGIACELVAGETPAERIPPYNLLHYGGALKSYFAKEKP